MSSLLAPACKYFICMMMSFVSVVMVMASAGAVLIMFMMMLMLFMVVVIMIVVLFFRQGIMGNKEITDLLKPRKKTKEVAK